MSIAYGFDMTAWRVAKPVLARRARRFRSAADSKVVD
jgi:hypothetical protein